MRVESILQSHVTVVHAAVLNAKSSGDDDNCLPVSSPARVRHCAVALLPPPVTFLPSCVSAVTLSGVRSEVSCARASCNSFAGSSIHETGDDFVHQWCAGRAVVQFGRSSFDAGVFIHLLRPCCPSRDNIVSSCGGG